MIVFQGMDGLFMEVETDFSRKVDDGFSGDQVAFQEISVNRLHILVPAAGSYVTGKTIFF